MKRPPDLAGGSLKAKLAAVQKEIFPLARFGPLISLRAMRFLIFWLLWLGCWLPVSLRAVEVTDGPHVETSGAQATIRWATDTPSGAAVRFGRNPSFLNRSEKSGSISREHAVTLDDLEPGATYHFSIGTARKALKTGQFTAGASRTPAAPPATPPAATKTPEKPALPAKTEAPEKNFEPSPLRAPPARLTWGNISTLRDHYERHGSDFAATSPEDYAAQAWRFLQRAKSEGLPAKLDPDGVIRVWDPKTRAFAAYNRDGTAKTYFKPESRDYFQRQPGRPVRLKASATTPR